jgi:tetratricopeptide (TPR) repeat protein
MMRSFIGLMMMLVAVTGWPADTGERVESEVQIPAGLSSFVEARVLEVNGQFREAVGAYERAIREEPSITEIKIGYAALLVKLGMAGRAVEILGKDGDLDWYGLRIRAHALAQYSARNSDALADAEAALRAALGDRRDDPSLQMSLAQILHRLGKIEEAEAEIADLRSVRGDSAQLIAYHARLLRELDRGQDAAELYAECAALDGADGLGCRGEIVDLLVELGRAGEAGEMMLSWLEDDDLDQLMQAVSLLYEGGRYQKALRTVHRVLRQAPDSPRARTLEALLLSSVGQYDEATDKLRVLVQKDKENLDLILALSWAAANSGDQKQARKWIDRAWELVGSDGGSLKAGRVALAGARVELVGEHTTLGRSWLDRVVDVQEVGGELVYLLVDSYRRDEQWREGIAALLRLQPRLDESARLQARAYEAEFRLRLDDPRAWKTLRVMLDSENLRENMIALQILQSLERWEDVDREADAILGRLPGDRDIVFVRAAALERLGRADDAEKLFQSLVESDPDDAASANYLGYMWADHGRNLDEALRLISLAVAVDPENSAYLDSLGWVHYRLGDLQQAEYWLQRAVEIGGDDPTVMSHLGEVLLKRGATDEARRLLQHALNAGCEHPDRVRELLAGIGDGYEHE